LYDGACGADFSSGLLCHSAISFLKFSVLSLKLFRDFSIAFLRKYHSPSGSNLSASNLVA